MRLLAAVLLTLLTMAGCVSLPARSHDHARVLDKNVQQAFLVAFPVYQMARTRAEAINVAQRDGRTVVNRFGHRSRLAGPEDRLVTTPNNDTLYSAAWLDLSEVPVVLIVPPLPERYNSVALLDIFTDNFAVLGSREQGGRGGTYFITGPGWSGQVPKGLVQIRAPTNDAWAIVRVLVDGPDDLKAAAAAQKRFVLEPLDRHCVSSLPTVPPRTPQAQELLREVNLLLSRGALPPDRAKVIARFRSLGIGPDAPGWDELEPAVRDSWQRQLPAILAKLRKGFASVGTVRGGWSYPRPGMGQYGDDEFYRAAVSLGGLAALPAEEASYLTATADADGRPLDGSRKYTLNIPANVPVRSFWSLSIYELDEDGRLFFTKNAIDRYALGSRTRGVVRNPDGSITVRIQTTRPEEGSANWLPAPTGEFRLTFRGYLPEPAFASGTFLLPPVEAATSTTP